MLWNVEGALIDVGMSVRGMQADSPKSNSQKGLVTRFRAHAFERLSGDQFCVYVAERLVLPKLREADIADIAAGRHSLDVHVRTYIHQHLGYRYTFCKDGAAALALERVIQRGEWPCGVPMLNVHRSRGLKGMKQRPKRTG